MGWQIALLKNGLQFDKTVQEAIYKLNEENFGEDWQEYAYECFTLNEFAPNNFEFYFNPDNMEHMDFMWNDDLQKILCDHKINGEILFGSLEGDNSGDFWGYRWTNGKFDLLIGKLQWGVYEENY